MRKSKTAAYNERFHASGAVPRPKGSVDFQVLHFVSSSVEAPPSPSRTAAGSRHYAKPRPVVRQQGTAERHLRVKRNLENLSYQEMK